MVLQSRSIRWAAWLLIASGFASSLERFSLDPRTPFFLYGVALLLVGYSSLDEWRAMGLKGLRLHAAASATGAVCLILVAAIIGPFVAAALRLPKT